MSGFFDPPKPPSPTPVVNPADTQNRINGALEKRLEGGGSNSTLLSSYMSGASGTGAASKQPTLTGLSG